ncbi:alpha/beta fold hydrolase [Streptomyces sp. NPDC088350]|uniref:alpha/beta fold hydrolase n=1 Tax=Streptomyces sp. NPDC088350 TaxID=3365854 RepID=UPI0037F6F8AF
MQWDRTESPGNALLLQHRPPRPRAAVLLLHGGQATSHRPTRPWQLAALRMGSLTRAVSAALPPEDVLIARVRYRLRGWNDDRADPVPDTLRALDQLAELTGPLPTVLLGHSMGARAALRAAGHPQVHGVVALAPWWPPGEPVDQTASRHIVALHGDRDHVTSPTETADCVRRARSTAARAGMAVIGGGDHAMLRRRHLWHDTAAALVAHLLDPGGMPDPLPEECYGTGDFPVL